MQAEKRCDNAEKSADHVGLAAGHAGKDKVDRAFFDVGYDLIKREEQYDQKAEGGN